VRAGLDANGNGVLDDAEVAKTSFACGAAPAPVVTRSAAEAPGSNCALGGTRVDAGRDANGNHVLDDAEVLDTAFVCNAASPAPPAVLSVVVSEPPDATCPFGGSEIRSGPDLDGNGTLDAGEISVVRHVCETQALPGFTIASDADLQLFDRASVVKGDVTVQSSTLDFVSLDAGKILGSIVVTQNPKLTGLSIERSFGGLSVTVSGNVIVTDNPVLTSIQIGDDLASTAGSRITGSMIVARNPSLASAVFGLNDLAEVDGNLTFEANDSLTELDLGGLRFVGGDFWLKGNAKLGQGGQTFIAATTVGGTVNLVGPGPVNVVNMVNLQAAGGVQLIGVNGGSLLAPRLRAVFGDVAVSNNPFGGFQFQELLAIGGSLTIAGNAAIASLLARFPALEHVGTTLAIESNPALAVLELGALRSARDVFVVDDPKLPTCAVQKLVAQLSPPPTSVSITGTDDTATCP
jgi:hypothetical protein